MIRYQDTGTPDDNVCPGKWFDANLIDGSQAFRGQFGFFRFGAIRKYSDVLRGMASSGKIVNLVLGSNSSDPLTNQDVRELLRLLTGSPHAHLTVVALSNAIFHSKVAHVIHPDGTTRAIVGSANMTEQALGIHVEAWVELESGLAVSDQALGDIAAAIDRWQTVTDEGVYQVRTEADADGLLARGILIDAAARRARRAASTAAASPSTGRGSRRARWRPPVLPEEPSLEGEAETLVVPETTKAVTPVGRIVLRWSKKLSKSDVGKNAKHPRNLMSLPTGRSPFAHAPDYLRKVFFAGADWLPANISKQPSEIAKIEFITKLPKGKTKKVTLEVVHAPHRESGQHNYRTSVRWGLLGGELQKARGIGYTGFWAVIEKHDTSEYSLTITADEPSRRFIG